jgi:hypothetical protein
MKHTANITLSIPFEYEEGQDPSEITADLIVAIKTHLETPCTNAQYLGIDVPALMQSAKVEAE